MIVATVQIPVRPPTRTAAGPDAVWVSHTGGVEILRINPTTNAIDETINLAEKTELVRCIAFADEHLWVTVFRDGDMRDTADTATRLAAPEGSTLALCAMAIEPGTLSGTRQPFRSNTTTTAPAGTRRIHHHDPDHGSDVGAPNSRSMPHLVTSE